MKKICFILLAQMNIFTWAQKVDTIQLPTEKIRSIELPDTLREISALEFDKRSTKTQPLFWGLNDSQNKNEIYLFDGNNGKIVQTLILEGADNFDWEEITQDENYLFVGEFGNNLGSRQNLSVFMIDKKQIDPKKEIQKVNYSTLSFYYPEQTSYQIKNRANDFDLEAFFAYKGKLHLFTKEWKSLQTTHYTIDPTITTKQAAKKIETFPTNYLVTAAFISEQQETAGIYLLGYTKEGIAFLNWFSIPENSERFFSTDKIINIPLGFVADWGQLEGVSVNPQRKEICVSGEEIDYRGMNAKQQLHCFPAELVIK